MSLLSSSAALVLAVQAAPADKVPSLDQRMTPQIQAAAQAVRAHQPQVAIDTLAPVLAAYDADHARETRRIYCAMSAPEALLYMGMAAEDGVSAVALPPGYCTALYLKGYALVISAGWRRPRRSTNA